MRGKDHFIKKIEAHTKKKVFSRLIKEIPLTLSLNLPHTIETPKVSLNRDQTSGS